MKAASTPDQPLGIDFYDSPIINPIIQIPTVRILKDIFLAHVSLTKPVRRNLMTVLMGAYMFTVRLA